MQYVEVIINRNRVEPLTYRPKSAQLPYIKPGCLVKVPLGHTTEWGIISKITKLHSSIAEYKIKEISELYPEIILCEINFFLARWLDRQYLSGFNEALFVQIPLNLPKKLADLQLKYKNLPQSDNKITKFITNFNQKQLLIDKIIAKAKINNKSVRIFIPDLNDAENIKSRFIKKYTPKVYTYSSKTSDKIKMQTINNYLINSNSIIIGGRYLGLIPPKKDEIWIVDSPASYSYRNEQNPKFHLVNLLSFFLPYVKIFTLNYIPFDFTNSQNDAFTNGQNQSSWKNTVEISQNENFFKQSDYYDGDNYCVIIPNQPPRKNLFCGHCYLMAKSNCCSEILQQIKGEWVCSGCKNAVKNLNCPVCNNPLTITEVSYDKIISKFTKTKKINLFECIEKKYSTALIIGFDHYLDKMTTLADFEFLEIIAQAKNIAKKVIIFTNLQNHPLLLILNNEVNDISRYLHDSTQNMRELPYYRTIKLVSKKPIPVEIKKMEEVINQLNNLNLKNFKYEKPYIDTKNHLNLIISVLDEDFIKISRWWEINYKTSIDSKWTVDIDPLKIV